MSVIWLLALLPISILQSCSAPEIPATVHPSKILNPLPVGKPSGAEELSLMLRSTTWKRWREAKPTDPPGLTRLVLVEDEKGDQFLLPTVDAQRLAVQHKRWRDWALDLEKLGAWDK